MKKWNSGVILILVLIMAGITLLAQTKSDSRKELEKKKEQLQQEIEETNKLLKLNQKNKNLTQAQLQQLNKKINAREELIRTINSELNELSGEINKTGREINSLNVQLDSLKMAYAAMIRFAYKNENKQSQMSYVFSADDFNQAVKRMKYLQEYSRHRQHQAALIGATKNVLNEKKGELEVQVKEKTSLKSNEEAERKNLTSEKKEQEVLMKNLTKQEATLRKQLAEKQAKKKKLDSAIEAAIKKEIEAAKKKAVAAGKKNVTKENAIALTLTPEAQKLSNSFAGNKGALPWPVEQGTITEYFGSHAHASLKGVTVKNDGIDISTNNNANVRSIFQGEVTGVINIPGSGGAVIVRHGEYLSVYSNLNTIAVNKGDKITTKQRLGTAGSDSETGRGMVNLQIWKGFDKMNPESWLAKR